jgi:beta-xylosidase
MEQLPVSGNPIIRHKFTADPTVLIYNDTVYLYTGHDEPPEGVDDYVMNDWLCFSSTDMINWHEHPSPLKARDFAWADGDAFASKVVYHNNKFYWYAAVTHASIKGKAIGVAVADNPAGPFTDAKGAALISQDMIPDKDIEMVNLDPSVIVTGDGQAYIFWGNSKCYYARLKSNMTALDSEIKTIELPGFAEGAHIHYRNGWYYLSYGYGSPEKVAYAMSRDINGPWEFKGILNELAGNCETNRPAIIDFNGRSYFFYHNGGLKNGGSHRRSVCVDELFYNDDGTMQRVIMTSEGVKAV